VIDRYGVPPELVPDFIGLKGDTSDNIPGVPGIGDKTAAQLLQEFGDLEGVLANIDGISGAKRKENLERHADDARVSKRLATAQRNVPVELDLDGVIGEPDRSRLREVFREFELRDPLRRVEEALGEGAAAPRQRPRVELEVHALEVPAAELARLEGGAASLAIERSEEGRALNFAAYQGGREVMVGEAETLAGLALAWGERGLLAHDWKSMRSGAARERADDSFGDAAVVHDTMVAAYLLDPARRDYSLTELADETGVGASVEGSAGEDGAAARRGLAERAVVSHALAERQRPLLDELDLGTLFREVELPLVQVLLEMERTGVKLDVTKLAEAGERYATRIAELEREVWELAGEEFVIGSPQQLSQVLFEKLGLSKKRRGKTGFSTDARVLAAIREEHPIVAKVEAWRELSKLKNTYLDALPELVDEHSGRLHTTFNQAATTTGRLSSTNPNLQNIPIRTELGREIRACFVAEPGCRLISADYSQVELRILAHVAGEETLRAVLGEGEDVHAATAAEMFEVDPLEVDPGLRSKAKMINFGIAYGLSPFGLSDRLQIPIEEATQVIDRYFERFPRIKEFIERTIGQATADGHVTTLFGRRRPIPELRERNPQTRQLGERLAVNTVIQGTAADIIKVAMVRCRDRLLGEGLTTRIVLQIHDELLFEGPAEEVAPASELVRTEMTGAFALDPALGVDVGTGENWLEAK
jgi:DNA polymerase-1